MMFKDVNILINVALEEVLTEHGILEIDNSLIKKDTSTPRYLFYYNDQLMLSLNSIDYNHKGGWAIEITKHLTTGDINATIEL